MVARTKLAQRIGVARAAEPRRTLAQISEDEGVPERTCRYIHAEWRPDADEIDDPFGLIDETLALYTQAIAAFAREAAEGDNSNARIGATRSLLEAAKGRLELLSALGRLPRHSAAAAEFRDVEAMVSEMAAVLDRHNVEEQAVAEMVAVLDARSGRGPPAER